MGTRPGNYHYRGKYGANIWGVIIGILSIGLRVALGLKSIMSTH